MYKPLENAWYRLKGKAEELAEQYSKKSLIGIGVIVFLALPEWDSAIAYWRGAPWSAIGHFFLTPLGRVAIGIAGLAIVIFDNRQVAAKKKHPAAGKEKLVYAERKPNLVMREIRERFVTYSDLNHGKFTVQGSYGTPALLITIENEPLAEFVPDSKDTRVRLRFLRETPEGKEVVSIANGWWVDRPSCGLNISVSSEATFVVATKKNGNLRCPANRNGEASGPGGLEDKPIPEYGQLTIQLIDGGQVMVEQKYDYQFAEGFKLQSIS